MDKLEFYYKFPVFLQNLTVSIKGWEIQRKRYAREFAEMLKKAEKRALWSPEQISEYRDNRLSDYLLYVYDHVPFYRQIFLELNVRPEEIKSLNDLDLLPVLNKKTINENYPDLISKAIPLKDHILAHTSGTTGSGFRFITTRRAQREQWAVWWRYRRYHGIQRGTLCGYFGGQSIVPPAENSPPYWRYDMPGNRILFSAYHLNPITIDSYIEEIRRKQPPWLHGYPSLIALLAAYINENRIDIGYQVKSITTGAENLLEQHKQSIYQAFGIHPIEHYGLAEGVANFSECKNGYLHVDEDFSAVEFISDSLSSGYKVIGTNLSNLAFPLIRYDTGDIVQLDEVECDCGLPGRIVSKVDGRKEDYVILDDGTKLGRLDHMFKDVSNIKEAQIYQGEVGAITVRVVPNRIFSLNDQHQIIEEFRKRIGDRLEIDFEMLEKIERSPSGKLRFVVSDVNQGQLERYEL
jgi:phenylacetate-CoA ligase